MTTALKSWMKAATAAEQAKLALAVGTSRAYLYQLSGGFRQASAELGSQIELKTAAMHKESGGRLPEIYRTDLVEACRGCAFAQKCLGPKAVRSDFDVVPEAK